MVSLIELSQQTGKSVLELLSIGYQQGTEHLQTLVQPTTTNPIDNSKLLDTLAQLKLLHRVPLDKIKNIEVEDLQLYVKKATMANELLLKAHGKIPVEYRSQIHPIVELDHIIESTRPLWEEKKEYLQLFGIEKNLDKVGPIYISAQEIRHRLAELDSLMGQGYEFISANQELISREFRFDLYKHTLEKVITEIRKTAYSIDYKKDPRCHTIQGL